MMKTKDAFLDYGLLIEIELLVDACYVHLHANLVWAYKIAVMAAHTTGDQKYRTLALEAERECRSLLSTLRLRRAGLPV